MNNEQDRSCSLYGLYFDSLCSMSLSKIFYQGTENNSIKQEQKVLHISGVFFYNKGT